MCEAHWFRYWDLEICKLNNIVYVAAIDQPYVVTIDLL